MNMPFSSKFSSIRQRVTAISVIISIITQFILVYIAISYARSMNEIAEENRLNDAIHQFYNNTLIQLDDIHNLLEILQTPEISNFFKQYMNLHERDVVIERKNDWLDLLRQLEVSQMANRIYFIGADINQASYYFETKTNQLVKMESIHMDFLQTVKLHTTFLKNNHQLVTYSNQQLTSILQEHAHKVEPEMQKEVLSFAAAVENKMIITNGNRNGVLVIIDLHADYFTKHIPPAHFDSYRFSLLNHDGDMIWSSREREDNVLYIDTSLAAEPYPYMISYSNRPDLSLHLQKKLWIHFIILSVAAVAVTFIFSMLYSRKLFIPYQKLSRQLKSQSQFPDSQLQSMKESLFNKGFHSFSLRGKLIVLFSIAVMIPAISVGGGYIYAVKQPLQTRMETMIQETGEYAAASIRLRMNYMNHLSNQLAVSDELRKYLTKRYRVDTFGARFDLSSFPGLNQFSNMILLDRIGNVIDSSDSSYHVDLFRLDSRFIRDESAPYWVSGYKDVFNQVTFGVLRQIEHIQNGVPAKNYLLLVPKNSVMDGVTPLESVVTITNESGVQIYGSRPYKIAKNHDYIRWSGNIPDTDWRLLIDYSVDQLTVKNEEYYNRLLFFVTSILFLSFIISYLITGLLLKPIRRLQYDMFLVAEGDFSGKVNYSGNNEIGDIIQSYNYMIGRLNAAIQENIRIATEKTQAELEMLQAQINPHFLYNTLETINMSSIKSGNHEIASLVSALADLLRYSIGKGFQTVPLEEELQYVMNYVAVQRIRFGDKFRLEFDIPDHLRHVHVVKFILQPIVENALIHGLSDLDTGGIIRVTARKNEGWLTIRVSDDGVGMDKEQVKKLNLEIKAGMQQNHSHNHKKGGMGLRNVYHRLRLGYDGKVSFDFYSKPMAGTDVLIAIPFRVSQ